MCLHHRFIETILWIQYLYHVKSQWTQIWYDNMEANTHWTKSTAGTITFGHSSESCQSDGCCRMEAESSSTDTFLVCVTDVSQYESLQLQFSVATRDMESGNSCFVTYSYEGPDAYVTLADLNPPNDGGRHNYFDQVEDLPSALGKDNLWIWLEIGGSSSDWCYWDNVYLYGIVDTTTTSPPSPKSTANRTGRPTDKPTTPPTMHPTYQPTHDPTPRPTDPNESTCDDVVIGSYHGSPVTFIVKIPHKGDLQFNAASSSFVVTDIEALTKLNVPLATDIDHDEVVTLYNAPAGDYKFIIMGEGVTMGTFEIRIGCTSPTPTSTQPSMGPLASTQTTVRPTVSPTTESHQTTSPSKDPTTPNTVIVVTTRPLVQTTEESVDALNPHGDNSAGTLEAIMAASIITLAICGLGYCIICTACYAFNGKKRAKKQDEDPQHVDNVQMVQSQQGTQGHVQETPASGNEETDTAAAKDRQALVAQWMDTSVQLSQYLTQFLHHGYDSLLIIACIESAQDLEAIGVKDRLHQITFMTEIDKLQLGLASDKPQLKARCSDSDVYGEGVRKLLWKHPNHGMLLTADCGNMNNDPKDSETAQEPAMNRIESNGSNSELYGDGPWNHTGNATDFGAQYAHNYQNNSARLSVLEETETSSR